MTAARQRREARRQPPTALDLRRMASASEHRFPVARAQAMYRDHRDEILERMETRALDARAYTNAAATCVFRFDDDADVRARAVELRGMTMEARRRLFA